MTEPRDAITRLARLPQPVRKALLVFIAVSSRKVTTKEALEERLRISAALHRGDSFRRPA